MGAVRRTRSHLFDGFLGQQPQQVFRRQRTGEIIALNHVHVPAPQQLHLLLRLHTLRNDAVAETAEGRYDALVEERGVFVRADVEQQRTVELDDRERQLHDRIQVGVARAEIVQAQADADRLKTLRHPGQARGVLGRNRFGNLKLEAGVRQTVFIQNADQVVSAIAVNKIERRKIDLDVRNARAKRRVFTQKTADAPQLKLGDLADKAVLLRKADKNIR